MSLWKALVNLIFEYYFKRKDNTRVQVFLLCNVLQGDRQVRDVPARPKVQSLRVKCIQWDRRGPVLLCPRPKLPQVLPAFFNKIGFFVG